MTKIIAVDIDETLSETIDAALKYHHYTIKNIPIIRSEITDYNIRNIPKCKEQGISQADGIIFFDEFLEGKDNTSAKTVLWAKEKLQEWKDAGYTIKIITGRPDTQQEQTKQRVQENFPNLFDDIIFANYFRAQEKSKGDICKEIGASVMIEDNLDFAQKIAEKGTLVYLLDKPRNQQYSNTNPNIIKVASRNDIIL